MMVEQQQRGNDNDMQFVQHFEMIKNEKTESELIDDKIYQDLSAKKQKLDQ